MDSSMIQHDCTHWDVSTPFCGDTLVSRIYVVIVLREPPNINLLFGRAKKTQIGKLHLMSYPEEWTLSCFLGGG